MKINVKKGITVPHRVAQNKRVEILVPASGNRFRLVSTSNLIKSEEKTFGNIIVRLVSLGSANYKIDWHSRMTGATISIAKLNRGAYAVLRKWASNKNLPVVSQNFEKRKPALVHFLNNVDIHKSTDKAMNEAKNFCLELFATRENLGVPKKPTLFKRFRLQGAIGKPVIVQSNNSKDHILAEGILLQLIDDKAELQLTTIHDLQSKKDIQKFAARQVYIR